MVRIARPGDNRARRNWSSATFARRTARYVATLLVPAFPALPTAPAFAGPAVGQFELKDLDNDVGEAEFQSQNAFFVGNSKRKVAETSPGEYAFDDNTVARARNALEMEFTLTSFFRLRVGIEYEKERFDDVELLADANRFSDWKLSEAAVEGVAILVPVKSDGVGFGLLAEFEHPVGGDEANTVTVGPILEAKSGPFSAILNLTLTHALSRGDKVAPDEVDDDKWDFSYAVQLKYDWSKSLALALEAYGTFERIGDTGERSENALLLGDSDQHRIGPVIYYSFELGPAEVGSRKTSPGSAHRDDRVVGVADDDGAEAPVATIGLGALFGLNSATSDATLKASLEIEF